MRKKTNGSPVLQAGRSNDARLVLFVIVCTITLFASFAVYLVSLPHMTAVERLTYFMLLFGLAYCCLSYQFNRLGAARRVLTHPQFTDAELSYLFADNAPSVTILIPSYREERRVLLMTVLSAALAQYSRRRIVVLVDDPPSDPASVRATLSTIDEARELLAEPVAAFRAEQAAWDKRIATGKFLAANEKERIAKTYRYAAEWLENLAASLRREVTPAFVHVDGFVIDKIVLDLAGLYRTQAKRVMAGKLDQAGAGREYKRLAELFCVDIENFERKTFENLSHAPNKAMNLNAYIGLMGGAFNVVEREGRSYIEEVSDGSHEFAVPDSDYVLTLDADSVILSDYILKLAHLLKTNPNYGVAQTPYLTFPNGSTAVERIAGATTDIQYLVHQGSTFFNASYWVGANALIRSAALRDIVCEQMENGKPVKVFIQDETVIEDTGSTIDLLSKGWAVHNHFTPLAYSATPADFGALAIQRKRWSNGGLIIFPMLLKEYFLGGGRLRRLPELLLRTNYLLSPVIGNLSIFLLMIWASPDGRALMWTPLVMFPYFVLYGLDLQRLGYRFLDILRVCALNLMLLPVSFAGIGSSLLQMVTGRKGRFSRTPKVSNRTFIPPYCFLFNIAMMSLMVYYVVDGLNYGEYWGALVPGINVVLYGYGLYQFVGVRDGAEDIVAVLLDGSKAARARLSNPQGAVGSLVLAGRRRMFVPAYTLLFLVFMPLGFGGGLQNGDLAGDAFALQNPVIAPVVEQRAAGAVESGARYILDRSGLFSGDVSVGQALTFSRYGVVLPVVTPGGPVAAEAATRPEARTMPVPGRPTVIDAAYHEIVPRRPLISPAGAASQRNVLPAAASALE